jgi:hypothetical protein
VIHPRAAAVARHHAVSLGHADSRGDARFTERRSVQHVTLGSRRAIRALTNLVLRAEAIGWLATRRFDSPASDRSRASWLHRAIRA